jgi:hypothetical protein
MAQRMCLISAMIKRWRSFARCFVEGETRLLFDQIELRQQFISFHLSLRFVLTAGRA